MRNYYHFTQEGDAPNKRYCPNNLQRLRDADYFIEQQKKEGLFIYRKGDWMLTFKSAPYTDRDLMLVYVGKSQNVSNIEDLKSHNSHEEGMKLIGDIVIFLEKEYRKELDSGKAEITFFVNNSLKPGPGNVQSVFRPHFHIGIYRKEIGEQNGVKTGVANILFKRNGKNNMGLNPQNLALIKDFKEYIQNKSSGKFRGEKSLILPSGEGYSLDFRMPDKKEFFSDRNIKYIGELHKWANSFIKGSFGRHSKNKSISRDKLGFTFGIFKKKGGIYIRLKFSYKNRGENTSMTHIIKRTNVEKPTPVIDNDFNSRIRREFG